ncbi:MAG: ASCH domain-containing protein [Atribacterota bacterium]|nr:ASCH domain-containing protein [Atribacterota bacterium]
MSFLLILDREHKALWVKNKNKPINAGWTLPEIEDSINKPASRLNVELLAKQAFIPLRASLLGKKYFLDTLQKQQLIYLFLCAGKESSEILFDLTKYKNIQWSPINCINESDIFLEISGKSIIETYHDILLNGHSFKKPSFHIVKNGYTKKEIEDYNKSVFNNNRRFTIELEEQYKFYHQPIPKIGDWTLLNNWKGIPLAILEITDVNPCTFQQIKKAIEKKEIKDDVYTEDVEKKYKKIFTAWCKNHNQIFSDDKNVIFSKFEIIHRFEERSMDYLK